MYINFPIYKNINIHIYNIKISKTSQLTKSGKSNQPWTQTREKTAATITKINKTSKSNDKQKTTTILSNKTTITTENVKE